MTTATSTLNEQRQQKLLMYRLLVRALLAIFAGTLCGVAIAFFVVYVLNW